MHYDLERWRGFFFQAAKDNTDFKRDLFWRYIVKKKSLCMLYRFVDKFKEGFFGSVVGLSFYVIIYLFLRFPRNRRRISMLQLNTEKKSYSDIFGKNRDEISLIYPGLSMSFLSFKSLIKQLSFKGITHNLRILGRILRRYDLFVALRSIQYLAYYDRFSLEIDKKSTRMITVFTDGNPHGRALMQLARKKNIKVCFISHGEPNEPMPPIYCDFAYLLGERSLLRYKKSKSCLGEVIYHGHRDIFKKIREVRFEESVRIGIFLSKSTYLDQVIKLAYLLEKTFECEAIMIREHPNRALLGKEKKRLLEDPKVRFSDAASIYRDIEECDFVLAGDSTVHIDTLLRGRPSLYYRGLERDAFDRYGYVQEGVVFDWDPGISPDDINNFYQDLNKNNRVSYYLNIERDSRESIKEINELVFEESI